MENDKQKETITKAFQTLPEQYRKKNIKGQKYAFYSYKHYGVYPGDLFYAFYQGKLILARAATKGCFEPFDIYDVLDGKEMLPFDDVIDMTEPRDPAIDAVEQEETVKQEVMVRVKRQMLAQFSSYLGERIRPEFMLVIRKACTTKNGPELKLGIFQRGSKDGRAYQIPETIENKGTIIMDGAEQEFMEPYFEINSPSEKMVEGERVPARQNEEKILFRKVSSLQDFFNLLEQGKPRLVLPVESLKARVSYPFHYIPAEWINGTYKSMIGTTYDLNETYWYFADQFVNNIGLTIVNLKQQMMPYYQRYSERPIPKDLRREDVLFLCSKWFVQDLRDGKYYCLQPAIVNEDGSYFCLDKKWFSLLHDRVRQRGKKEVCDINDFTFRSSKDKRYFQLFSLEPEELAYAFEKAIEIPNVNDFYRQMDLHFNPGYQKSGNVENQEPIRLTEDQKRRIQEASTLYLEGDKKGGE